MPARRLLCFIVILLVAWGESETGHPLHAAPPGAQVEIELRQTLTTSFPRWDRNQDNALDGREINALIENPQVRGGEAAGVVIIRNHLLFSGENSQDQKLSREVILGLAYDRGAQRDFLQLKNRMTSGSRALFLPGDPNLGAFNQGRLGDCYLLSTIGAFLNRDPKAVLAMIKPKPGNAFEVNFASGRKVAVSPVTDAELVMGSKPGSDRGIWLVVLEKAYASIREEKSGPKSGKSVKANDVVVMDFLDIGSPVPVIRDLTGHRAHVENWDGEETKVTIEHLHELLGTLTRDRKLCLASTFRDRSTPLPKGIIPRHVIAVLAYDSKRRMVRMFNPWGNDLIPTGPPGMINGYLTRQGLFEIPLLIIECKFFHSPFSE